MFEEVMEWFFDHPFVSVLCIVAVVVAIGVYIGTKADQETERLIAQCLADGKKEYECRAMFKESTPTIIYMSK